VYCRYLKGGGFAAAAKIGERDLAVSIIDWHGFRPYTLRYSPNYKKPIVEALDYSAEAESGYGNIFAPEQLHGTVAGKVRFPRTTRGRRIAINLPFGYNHLSDVAPPDQDLTTLSISGSAPCRWRKPPWWP
jgi:hypothetical protein